MARFAAGVLAGLALAGLAFTAGSIATGDTLAVPSIEALTHRAEAVVAPPPSGPTPIVLFVDRDGAVVPAGPDSATMRASSVLLAQNLSHVEVPPFRGGDRKWTAFRRCLAAQFDGFAVTVVDEPPPTGDYITVHVGGRSKLLGLPKRVAGIAPHRGTVIPNAQVFVFERKGSSSRDLCEVAAHEVGHAVGLDHSRACRDVMSYRACGKKSFRDQAANCGEQKSRLCASGVKTQNSWRELARLVGVRPGPRVS